ncbi:MAG: replication initiator [Acidimicrobiales bacterium]
MGPEHPHGPPPGALDEVLARAGDREGYERWSDQALHTGYCRHPIRLVGHIDHIETVTGEIRRRVDSAEQPDGVILVACGNRRASVCPSCSSTYQADVYQLVAAGLKGGKGVSPEVAGHPRVFLTLTAPSFGTVHGVRQDAGGEPAPCRPAWPGRPARCTHAVPAVCERLHDRQDPAVGQPLCPECFDYPAAVLWNAHAGQLWARTVGVIRRALARHAGLSIREAAALVRVSFVKTTEYQRRGLIHVHSLVRLDGIAPGGGGTAPPPEPFDTANLVATIYGAVPTVRCPLASAAQKLLGEVRWGDQMDVHIVASVAEAMSAEGRIDTAAAGYLAKYSVKGADPEGLLDHRLHSLYELEGSSLTPHLRRMVEVAWQLGADPALGHLRLRAWAHMLGFRGHHTTKSRRYSTTLGALRSARAQHMAGTRDDTPEDVARVGSLCFAGQGYRTAGDAWLAETAGEAHRAERQAARLERASGAPPLNEPETEGR